MLTRPHSQSRDVSRPLYDGLGLEAWGLGLGHKGSGLETLSQEGLKSDRHDIAAGNASFLIKQV